MSAIASCIESALCPPCQSLADLEVGQAARVVSVTAHDGVPNDLARRLLDLGFLPGEHVQVMARGPLGREPIAVRIGTATFGLRRLEAGCIRIVPLGD